MITIIIKFISVFILILLYYNFVELKRRKRFTKKNIPPDLKLLIQTQNIYIKKISYKKLMKIVIITNAIDISLVFIIVDSINSIILKFLIAIPVIGLVLFISYELLGKILEKKNKTIVNN